MFNSRNFRYAKSHKNCVWYKLRLNTFPFTHIFTNFITALLLGRA